MIFFRSVMIFFRSNDYDFTIGYIFRFEQMCFVNAFDVAILTFKFRFLFKVQVICGFSFLIFANID